MRLSRLSSFAFLSFLTVASALQGFACRGDTEENQVTPDAGPNPDAGPSPDAQPPEAGPLVDEDRPLIPASKVDLLLVVDNSALMGDKAAVLASSLGTLLRDVAKVGDVHVGVVSSSLGNMGGDVCSPENPATNRRAHLAKTGPNGAPVPGAETGVLSYSGGDVETFVTAAASLVRGVGETGCGFEAQLESAYRFLVQPDPWEAVTVDANNQADLGTTLDVELLGQRKAFLRNDSALVVLMLTDEDDSAADPLSIGGQGWAFMAKNFPGSQVFRDANLGTTAARATTTCATNPASADCTSCVFASICDPNDAACQRLKNDANCTTSPIPGKSGPGYDGYYGPDEDWFGVRFHRMKERFGIDPQFPLSRYIDGFTKSVVPDRRGEHPTQVGESGRREILPYAGTPTCINPIFAESLPSSPGDEICVLKRGPRSRELVFFAVLGGVPSSLVTATPDWTKILGNDPDAYDYSGVDPHMIPSVEPRQGLPAPSDTLGDNGPDPIHGREWNTSKQDLQFACSFELSSPKQCPDSNSTCECFPEIQNIPPLCGATPGQQLRSKAYPTLRPLRVAKGLGERGIIGSICANSYDETMTVLSTRLASRLAK